MDDEQCRCGLDWVGRLIRRASERDRYRLAWQSARIRALRTQAKFELSDQAVKRWVAAYEQVKAENNDLVARLEAYQQMRQECAETLDRETQP